MLSIRNLSKRFGVASSPSPSTSPLARSIFEHLDFHLAEGEYVALMGESGAGKSTLLNIIAGLEPASGGEISLAGRTLDAGDDERITLFRRAKLGFIFQAFHLLPYLNAFDNIALPLRLNRWRDDDIRARVSEMLAAVGLADQAAAMPRELSGGEMQRVAIARALAHRPALLLADEPTGNLDLDTAQQILALLRSEIRRNGTTAILVTHSGIAARSADRAVMLTRQGIVPHAV